MKFNLLSILTVLAKINELYARLPELMTNEFVEGNMPVGSYEGRRLRLTLRLSLDK